MTDQTYSPADSLGEIKIGDWVDLHSSRGIVPGPPLVIAKVGKTFVQTEDGRRWTIEHGEWIAAMAGRQRETYPYPWISKRESRVLTEEDKAAIRGQSEAAFWNAKKVLKPGDRLVVTKCPGTKRWITFAGWDGYWIVSTSGINDYSPRSVSRVNGQRVAFYLSAQPLGETE